MHRKLISLIVVMPLLAGLVQAQPTMPTGPFYLESYDMPGYFMTCTTTATGNRPIQLIQGKTPEAQWLVGTAFAGTGTISLTPVVSPGWYVRHANWILYTAASATADQYFNNDASWRVRAGLAKPSDPTLVSFENNQYGNNYIQHNAPGTTPITFGPSANGQLTVTAATYGLATFKIVLPGTEKASNPVPDDKATDVIREIIVGWKPGVYAATHNVYWGTTFDDVNIASTGSPLLVSPGQDANTYDPPGRLSLGQTYYWRIDEVNAPPTSSTVFKGNVWSFTVEPYSIPVKKIIATASSQSSTTTGPENTINGSGLDTSELLHSTTTAAMWLTAKGAATPASIQYEFDRVYKLHQMWVWNHNSTAEGTLGFGLKNVTIQYSTDGTNFTKLGDFDLRKAPGTANYAHSDEVPFGGITARYVKITVNTGWGTRGQYGLSEVRFLYIPTFARDPQPVSGATGISTDVALSWRPGREAASHKVYLGTDPNALSQIGSADSASYAPSGLNLSATYYWRIDEVNTAEAPSLWTGDVWSFSVADSVVVDDMESYNDSSNRMFDVWVDGFGTTTNGALAGYGQSANGTFGETTTFHGGKQSMPFFYTNTLSITNSEAVRTFDAAQDWTQHGIKGLSLFFYGDPTNGAVQPYVKINSTKVVYSGKAEDIKRSQWQPWNVDLSKVAASTLKSVTKLAIGVDGAGVSGKLFFDDIRLYPSAGELITPVDPGTTGLAAWYKFDGDFKTSVGTFNGTARSDAKIVSDPIRGQVLSLDGVDDGVDVPKLGSGNTLTISLWANTTVDPVPLQYASFFHCNGWEAADIHWRYQYGKVNSGINGGPADLTGTAVVKANQWNHVAVTVSATEWALWLNGLKEASRTLTAPVTVTLGEGIIGAWLGTDGTTISRAFTGMIDEVRFYNRTLSQAELGWLAGRTDPFAKPF